MRRTYRKQNTRRTPLDGVLILLIAGVIALGLGLFFSQLSTVLRQNNSLRTLRAGIEQLECDAVNYRDCIAQYRDPDIVLPRAESFGMIPADAAHTRIVSLPNRPQSSTAMSAENIQP